jgi:hypothetical protein
MLDDHLNYFFKKIRNFDGHPTRLTFIQPFINSRMTFDQIEN